MDSEGFIKNIEVFPDTHYFVYKNKRYPIKFDFFKYSSKYFQINQNEIQTSKDIQLLDSSENDLELSDDSITSFIKFVQGNQIQLTPENVVNLNYLSTKYEVSTLKKYTEDYIEKNHQKIAIDLLHQRENDRTLDKSIYEEMIAMHLDEYIHNGKLADLQIPTLYRILKKNRQKISQKQQTSKEIIEFIFIVLRKYGRSASILFSEVDFGDAKIEYVNRLLTDFSTDFDFNFINSTLLQTLNETNSELLKREKEHKIEIENLKKGIEKFEKKQKEETNELVSNIKGELLGEIEKLRQEVKRLNEAQTNDKMIFQQKTNSLNDEIKSIKKNITNLQKLNKEEENITNLQKLNQEDENKIVTKGVEIPLLHHNDFDGIINYLMKTKKDEFELITSSFRSAASLLEFNCDSCYTFEANSEAWICFDLKKMRAKFTGYSIKSHKKGKDYFQLKSWIIQVSNDGEKWSTIDEQTDCPTLNDSAVTGTFDVKPNDYSRYVRLLQTGKPWGGHCLWFHYIEFYGYLME